MAESYLPAFLEPLLAQRYSPDDVARIMAGLGARRAVTLRANTLAADREEVAIELAAAGIEWEDVPWCGDAFVLAGARERDVWGLDAYAKGKVYLQNLSSMIPALALDPQPGEDICDMCAAPGGKTTQIVALTDARAFVTACEMRPPRADKLEHNLAKLGARNVSVMRVDARKLDDFFSFDRLLVDAPCSGSGTLQASDPRVAKRFTEKLVERSVKAQRALLSKALSLVKPGGTVVYSTCSVLARENEEVVEWVLDHARGRGSFEVKPVELEAGDSLPRLPVRLDGALGVCPTDRYEGFFVAKITRTAYA